MKLELKHLAPYLPYGLNLQFFEMTYLMIGLRGDIVYLENGYEKLGNPYLKPLLHPLDMLTKEIEHNGEKFVPIIELSKLAGNGLDKMEVDNIEIESETAILWFKEKPTHPRFKLPKSRICFEIDMDKPNKGGVGFDIVREYESSEINDPFYPPNNQLVLFQKLFEWHFDVFGLIPEGLAINKLTNK